MYEEQGEKLYAQAGKLMRDVYYPFSACIWLNEKGHVMDIYLFDTLHHTPECIVPDCAKQCILISNHPDGNMRPADEDMRNWQMLKEKMPERRCRLIIFSEDEGLCEMAQR